MASEKVTITMSVKDLQAVLSYMQISNDFYDYDMDKHTEHVYKELSAVLFATRTWQEENATWQRALQLNKNVVPFRKLAKKPSGKMLPQGY